MLLSFAYTLLLFRVEAALHLVGLDPFIGFLHVAVPGRPALAIDLMEEFRPVIADSAVIRALNTGAITPADFSPSEDASRPIVIS